MCIASVSKLSISYWEEEFTGMDTEARMKDEGGRMKRVLFKDERYMFE